MRQGNVITYLATADSRRVNGDTDAAVRRRYDQIQESDSVLGEAALLSWGRAGVPLQLRIYYESLSYDDTAD